MYLSCPGAALLLWIGCAALTKGVANRAKCVGMGGKSSVSRPDGERGRAGTPAVLELWGRSTRGSCDGGWCGSDEGGAGIHSRCCRLGGRDGTHRNETRRVAAAGWAAVWARWVAPADGNEEKPRRERGVERDSTLQPTTSPLRSPGRIIHKERARAICFSRRLCTAKPVAAARRSRPSPRR